MRSLPCLGAVLLLAGCTAAVPGGVPVTSAPTAASSAPAAASPTVSSTASATASPRAAVTPRATPSASDRARPVRSFKQTPDPCTLVDTKDVALLAGMRVGAPYEDVADLLPYCVWEAADGRAVEVQSIPAQVWGRRLPTFAHDLEENNPGFPAHSVQALREIAEDFDGTDPITPKRACEGFVRLAEAQGFAHNDTSSIGEILWDDQEGIAAETCLDGLYTSVYYYAPPDALGQLPTDDSLWRLVDLADEAARAGGVPG